MADGKFTSSVTSENFDKALEGGLYAIRHDAQELTAEQKAQARSNIGAADAETLHQLSEEKVNKPTTAGTAGQFLTSDGNGGTAWVSLPMYNGEVEDT